MGGPPPCFTSTHTFSAHISCSSYSPMSAMFLTNVGLNTNCWKSAFDRLHARDTYAVQPPDMASGSSAKLSSSLQPPHRFLVLPEPSSSPSHPFSIPNRSKYQQSTFARDTPRQTSPPSHTGQHASHLSGVVQSSVRLYPSNWQVGKRYRKY